MITKNEAEAYIRMELKQWKLDHVDVKWFRRVDQFNGIADVVNDRLFFSEKLLIRGIGVLMEIVKHEIAHILDFKERGGFENEHPDDEGHGPNWEKWCKIMKIPARSHT